ncbi:MAG: Ig-like domain-containing protein [Muribaculaceae bacterium]|nr:Ig-like domain-containing protein [Muribaculaceae bacterium]
MNRLRFVMFIGLCMCVSNIYAAGSYSVNVGETIRLSFTPIDGVLTHTIRWESNAPTYLEVESYIGCTATIRALKPFGSRVLIQCAYERVIYRGTFKYVKKETEDFYVTINEVKPTSISLPSNVTITVGNYRTLTPTITPSNATTTLSWSSSNGSIASVFQDGSVYANAAGTAVITVRTDNGLSDYCNVVVKEATPTGISVSPSTLNLPIGDSRKLSYSVTPSYAETSVTWSLDDYNGVVSLDADGTVTALKAGTAVARAKTDNGYSATCKITVHPMPESIELPKKVSLMYGKSRELKVISQPVDAYLKLTWTSTDNSVVTVTSDGKITARKPGIADVIATASNGVSATCRVEVDEPVFNFIVWTSDESKLVYSLKEKPQVTFSEQNIIVETSQQRVEYAKDKVEKFTLEDATVQRMPLSIDMPEYLELAYKQKMQLEYTLNPADYDIETSLTWTSDNTEVARVNQSGMVTACYPGIAVVTVTAANGCSASCTVTVPEPEFYFVVWLESGGIVAYSLVEHPQVTYNEGILEVATDVKEIMLEPDKVNKFTINGSIPDVAVAIDENEMAGKKIVKGNDSVSFVNCRPGMDVYVYTMGGMLLKTTKTDSDGMLYLSLEELDAGVYIVKSEEITSKILKK